jgi:hypothetical protein
MNYETWLKLTPQERLDWFNLEIAPKIKYNLKEDICNLEFWHNSAKKWSFSCNPSPKESFYRIKPEPTPEEIIKKWVKENNIVEGESFLKRKFSGTIYKVKCVEKTIIKISSEGGIGIIGIEDLSDYEKYMPTPEEQFKKYIEERGFEVGKEVYYETNKMKGTIIKIADDYFSIRWSDGCLAHFHSYDNRDLDNIKLLKYRPIANFDEFKPFLIERTFCIHKESGIIRTITGYHPKSENIAISTYSIDFREAFNCYEIFNLKTKERSPFGVLE